MLINEIFHSVQGEGRFQGTPAIFIRTSGCPNNCFFCDTKHQNGTTMTVSDIVKEVKAISAKCDADVEHIVLTGGEPMMQDIDELVKLLCWLTTHSYTVQIETSGYHDGNLRRCKAVDVQNVYVTLSPKDPVCKTYTLDTLETQLPNADEYKFVYPFETNLVETVYNHCRGFAHPMDIALQPMTVINNGIVDRAETEKNTLETLALCLRNNHIFSARLHILLNFR